MQENNFEQKVQQRMEELNVSPSGAVWDHVYARIRKEKRRRRFILWFFLCGALLVGGVVLRFSGKKDKDIITDRTNVKTTAAGEETKRDKTIIPDEINNQGNEIAGEQKQPESKGGPVKKKEIIAEKKQIPLKEFRLPGKFKKDYTPGQENKGLKNNKAEPAQLNPAEDLKNDQQSNLKKADAGRTPPADFTKPVTADSNNADKQTPQQTPAVDSLQQKITQLPPADKKADSILLKTEETKKVNDSLKQKSEKLKDPAVAVKPLAKKWRWGVHFTPGISSMNEKLFSLGNTKSADAFASPTSGGPITLPASPSKSKPGFAFQVGVFVQRNLSRRTKFETGLQYGYYSDRITVGIRTGSVSQSLLDYSVIYGAGDSIKFTNRYHFIELPAGVKIQMNKKPVKPLYLNMGFNIGWMAGTNALVYDTASGGIYYNSKRHFNRLQFSLSLGLDWTLFKNDKIEWHIGPVINLHLNQMLNNPLDRNKYLFFAGIRTSILFNKKK